MCGLETYLHSFPPGDNVLAVEEDLAREVIADEKPKLAAPVHHLAPVLPLLGFRVQLIDLALQSRARRDYLGSRLEATFLLDWGRGHFTILITRGQRSLPVSFARHWTAASGLWAMKEFIHLTFPR